MSISRALMTIIDAAGLIPPPLSGTTCIAGRSFTVPQVCGSVADKEGAVITDAKIQTTPKNYPEGEKDVSSDKKENLLMPNVTDGEYELRVKYCGFSDAWQPFRMSGSGANRNCTKPIHVVMVPAGACSYVENAWKNLNGRSEL